MRQRGDCTEIYGFEFYDAIFGTTPEVFKSAVVERFGMLDVVSFYAEGDAKPQTWTYLNAPSQAFLDTLIRHVAWCYPGEKIPQEASVAVAIVAYPRRMDYLFGHSLYNVNGENADLYVIETYNLNRWGFAIWRELGLMYVKPKDVPMETIRLMDRYVCPVQIRVFGVDKKENDGG